LSEKNSLQKHLFSNGGIFAKNEVSACSPLRKSQCHAAAAAKKRKQHSQEILFA
jgi:hypothetical protein